VSSLNLDQPLRQLEFVAFDTETTGLHPSSERVVELSAVRFSLDGEIATFDQLVDPKIPIPDAAARVHGIRDGDVSGKPTVDTLLPKFTEFVEGAVLLAHNAEFDVGFLAHEARRCGQALPRVAILDTVELARQLRSDLPNHKLETLSRALGCEAGEYHRALADAQTLRQVFLRLVEMLEGPTFRSLLALTTGALSFGPDERLWMWLPPELRALDDAMVAGSRVTILYEPEGKRQDAREIVPTGWMRRPGGAFLVARGDREQSDRSYRLDWIKRAQYAQASLF